MHRTAPRLNTAVGRCSLPHCDWSAPVGFLGFSGTDGVRVIACAATGRHYCPQQQHEVKHSRNRVMLIAWEGPFRVGWHSEVFHELLLDLLRTDLVELVYHHAHGGELIRRNAVRVQHAAQHLAAVDLDAHLVHMEHAKPSNTLATAITRLSRKIVPLWRSSVDGPRGFSLTDLGFNLPTPDDVHVPL
eukprot:1033103-Pyramimonas_sp.AAC.1